jgi:hypothetical protein
LESNLKEWVQRDSAVLGVIVLAALIGFLLRAALVLQGHPALNSDEMNYYHFLQNLGMGQGSEDYVGWRWSRYELRFWMFYIPFRWMGSDLRSLGFIACFWNVVVSLAWGWVFLRRFRDLRLVWPILFFIAIPAPCLSSWGTLLCEFRSSILYGAILMGFAGKWGKSALGMAGFSLVAALGLFEDLFTVFFIVPVLLYERSLWMERVRARPWAIALLAALWLVITFRFVAGGTWGDQIRQHYLHAGFGGPGEWWRHLKILALFPLYWMGQVPWGYLQNSSVGVFLNPPSGHWFQGFCSWAFVLLVFATFFLGLLTPKEEKRRERMLLLSPMLMFLLFFIFGSQVWDALSLRYLWFFQFVPALVLGKAMEYGEKRAAWSKFVLASWMALDLAALAPLLFHPYHSPARAICKELLDRDARCGFANYWASEMIRYESDDQLRFAPYDHSPISFAAYQGSLTAPDTYVVWVQGLDPSTGPQVLSERIAALGYWPVSRTDYPEGWSLYQWKKRKARSR